MPARSDAAISECPGNLESRRARGRAERRLEAPENGPALADSKIARPRPKTNNPSTLEAIDLDDILEWDVLYDVNGEADAVAEAASTRPVSENLVSVADASDSSGSADLGIWGELYRVASEPFAAVAQTETDRSLTEESELLDFDRSCICTFGDFEIAEGAPPANAAKPVDGPKLHSGGLG